MENIKNCPVCGGETLIGVLEAKDFLVSKKNFSIVKCINCDFIFTNPRPEETNISDYYASESYISHTDSKKSLFDRIYQGVRKYMIDKKLRLLLKNVNNTQRLSLLDYGCATGDFLLRASQKGMDVTGYEPDDSARKKAELKGLTIIDSVLHLKQNEMRNRFDFITLWHVLEHVPDLNEKIKLLSELLKKDGLIVVAVPEHKSYDAVYYKELWAAWDVPRHFNHFEKKTLIELFHQNSFQLLKIYPLMFDSYYISLLSEKAKNSGLIGYFRAFVIGFKSNFRAMLGKSPYSSQIYFFKHISTDNQLS